MRYILFLGTNRIAFNKYMYIAKFKLNKHKNNNTDVLILAKEPYICALDKYFFAQLNIANTGTYFLKLISENANMM
jgi:hypothetical protein